MPTYASGTDGRIRLGASDTAVAGVSSWRINQRADTHDSTNFESSADANGIVHATHTVGVAKTTISLEAFIDIDVTAFTTSTVTFGTDQNIPKFPIGTLVTLDLMVSKTYPYGYGDVSARVIGITPNTGMSQNARFGVELEVQGVMPAAQTFPT